MPHGLKLNYKELVKSGQDSKVCRRPKTEECTFFSRVRSRFLVSFSGVLIDNKFRHAGLISLAKTLCNTFSWYWYASDRV